MSDSQAADLLARARAGDGQAMGDLYRHHLNYGRALARGCGVATADIDDVVQEAWARVLYQLAAGRGPTLHLRGYLARTIRSVSIAQWRATRRMVLADDSELELLAGRQHCDDAEYAVHDAEEVESALAALASLPPRARHLLEETFADGYRCEAAAARIGATPNALAARASRARKVLRSAHADQREQENTPQPTSPRTGVNG